MIKAQILHFHSEPICNCFRTILYYLLFSLIFAQQIASNVGGFQTMNMKVLLKTVIKFK